MSNAPDDLLVIRADYARRTGTALTDNGIAADDSHLSSGGYHCGALDLRRIDAVGKDDYSIRQPRDRAIYNHDVAAGNNNASAMDFDDDWPNGGRPAWIRYNNNLRSRLGARDPALVAIRGINYTPDGTTKRRFDCLTGTEGSTTDTVLWHTHMEFWRDTINNEQRRWARARLDNIVEASIRNVPVDQVIAEKQTAADAAQQILGTDMNWVTLRIGGNYGALPDGAQSINGRPLVNNSRGLITPKGFWVANADNYTASSGATPPSTFWDQTPQFSYGQIMDIADALKMTANLTAEQYSDFKAQAVPIVHDAAESGAQAGASGPWEVTRGTPQ